QNPASAGEPVLYGTHGAAVPPGQLPREPQADLQSVAGVFHAGRPERTLGRLGRMSAGMATAEARKDTHKARASAGRIDADSNPGGRETHHRVVQVQIAKLTRPVAAVPL